MKFIDKSKSSSAANALHHWRDAFRNKDGKTFEDICKELNSDAAWNLISEHGKGLKNQLRIALAQEQGSICCYCVQEVDIELESKTVIEHFLSKSDDVCNNTYNYQNLLLSCDGNAGESGKDHQVNVRKGATWQEVLENIEKLHIRFPDFKLDLDDLKKRNPRQQKKDKPKEKVIFRLSPRHCDNYKADKKEVILNPTSLPDCWEQFKYDKTGLIEGITDLARVTIAVLNLNATLLEQQRAEKWAFFETAFNEDPNLAEYFEKEDWKGLALFTKDELNKEIDFNLTYPFCVVRRAFLKQEAEKYERF